MQPAKALQLSDAKINFQRQGLQQEPAPFKIVSVEFAGVTVQSLDLVGTMLRMQLYCSPAMWATWSRWVGGTDGPDISKGSQFHAILFVQHYYNNEDEWAMDDTAADWDQAVGDLLTSLEAAHQTESIK